MARDRRQPAVVTFQKYALNPVTKLVAGLFPGWILLETTGRRSGKRRRTPLGGTRDGDVYWVVSEQGRSANYVRNIEREPKVRVRINGRWRTGRATIVPDDDVQARLRTQSLWNRTAVRLAGKNLLTVRLDLDPR